LVVGVDDPATRQVVRTVLEADEYQVVEAADGAAALRALDAGGAVDLLFTDVVLPNGMSGAQLAARAKARWPTLRVLFTTGYARNAIVHHGRLDPGVELLTKPFTFAALASKVREVLDAAVGG
jgi:CheY-like chemotaxis protein